MIAGARPATTPGAAGCGLHDLHHTAASQAAMASENLPLVGRMLGHRRRRTTAAYTHVADAHLVEAPERGGAVIAEGMARAASV